MVKNKIEVQIVSDSGTEKGICLYKQYTLIESGLYGFGIFIAVWLVTIPTILIPIFHFLTVPTGFFAGPFFGYIAFKNRHKVRILEDIKSKCPKCRAPLDFSIKNAQENLAGHCSGCGCDFAVVLPSLKID